MKPDINDVRPGPRSLSSPNYAVTPHRVLFAYLFPCLQPFTCQLGNYLEYLIPELEMGPLYQTDRSDCCGAQLRSNPSGEMQSLFSPRFFERHYYQTCRAVQYGLDSEIRGLNASDVDGPHSNRWAVQHVTVFLVVIRGVWDRHSSMPWAGTVIKRSGA